MNVLGSILQQKRSELEPLRRRQLPSPPPVRRVDLQRSPKQGLRLLAEFKRRSPSAGELSAALTVEQRARAYERAGATMMSVLCDSTFFGGSFEDLTRARSASQLPLLCKEFVIDEIQLDAARAYGADAVLLIVRCLETEALTRLVRGALARDLVPLVEAHGNDEAQAAADSGASVIGVNARNLDSLEMDAEGAAETLSRLPSSLTRLHLSGVKSPQDAAAIAASGVDGALVGECLMRQDDPEPLLRALVAAGETAAARTDR